MKKQPKKKLASKRADGRGHWPASVRRNPDVGDWSAIRLALATLLNDSPRHGVISRRVLAADLGVAEGSVRRWLAGIDRPAADTQAAIRQWIAERRKELARERGRKREREKGR